MAAESSFGLWETLLIGVAALFAGLMVLVVWLANRRKEREEFTRSEMLRRLAESPGEGARAAVELLREEGRQRDHRKLEGMKAGGVVSVALGLGLMAMLHGFAADEPVYWCGVLPVLGGAGLLVYVYGLAKRAE